MIQERIDIFERPNQLIRSNCFKKMNNLKSCCLRSSKILKISKNLINKSRKFQMEVLDVQNQDLKLNSLTSISKKIKLLNHEYESLKKSFKIKC